MLKTISTLIIGLLATGHVAAQSSPPIRYQPDPDSPIGERHPDAPEALAAYDFLIGDWDVDITFTRPGGDPFRYDARWHNHWILDGQAVMQEWRGPYATGMELRFYNPVTEQLEGYNLYPGSGDGARATRSQWFGDRLEVTISSTDAEGPLLNRETYLDITPDSFRMYSDRSRDDGATWQTGRYSMTARRAAAPVGIED